MEPTLAVGSRYFVNKLAYKASSPKRGDLIVFRTNASDDAALHIRRVIGLPGETIQIVNGRILINGETYKEGKDFPAINNPGMAANAITLEAGEYFVLGDNRNNSEDSRYGDIGRVNKKYITGKLWFQISPKKDTAESHPAAAESHRWPRPAGVSSAEPNSAGVPEICTSSSAIISPKTLFVTTTSNAHG